MAVQGSLRNMRQTACSVRSADRPAMDITGGVRSSGPAAKPQACQVPYSPSADEMMAHPNIGKACPQPCAKINSACLWTAAAKR